MSHGTRMTRVTVHLRTSHATRMKRHATRRNESWHTHEQVMSHTWTYWAYGEVMAHTGTSHVTQMIESWHVTCMHASWHIDDWVMTHTCMRHGTHIMRLHASWQRRDRGIYSIWGGRSLYCLHFGISQLMGPEACFGIFVREGLGWLSNRSLYQTFSVNLSLLYQAVGTQANDEKSFQYDLSIWKVFW